ncbi:hypothetical protein HY732_02745 [Candidatus Uhrbacteria bacterium]|nr:hypothetical protein [Candidatus Uhrbacteria bacterium]
MRNKNEEIPSSEGEGAQGEKKETKRDRIRRELLLFYGGVVGEWERVYRDNQHNLWVQHAAYQYGAESQEKYKERVDRNVETMKKNSMMNFKE